MRSEGNNVISVDFAGYYQTSLRYVQLNDGGSQYGMTEEQLIERYGLNPNGRGTALIECSRTDTGWDFHMVRLEATVAE